MPQFTVNALRFDPYQNFKFRLMWDGRYLAGISKVSALKRSTEVIGDYARRRSDLACAAASTAARVASGSSSNSTAHA